MFEIVNDPRNYSWGSKTALATMFGREPSGLPEAEVWFGDHAMSPSRIAETGETLIEWGERHPERIGGGPLPFLVKLLAADAPLSIQVHPTRDQARAGFERENTLGVPVDAPNRNYRDANHKPEVIVALTEFSALCGFRPRESRRRILDHLDALGVGGIDVLRGPLKESVAAILGNTGDTPTLIAALATVDPAAAHDDDVRDALEVAVQLARLFPGDPGSVISLLLNHRTMQPGEALFLPAGNIHAYLRGVGVEVMATSDNVLRGGLTDKHVDVAELLAIADFTELPEPSLTPTIDGPVRTFAPAAADFVVRDVAVAGAASIDVLGPAIVVATVGSVECHASNRVTLTGGRAAFVEAGERLVELAGTGRAFVASLPRH